MAFVTIWGTQLGIDIASAGLALAIFACSVACAMLFINHRFLTAAAMLGVFALVGTIYFAYRTVITPSGSWPVMYAALKEVSGRERRERIEALVPMFHFGEVRQLDWYLLSQRWNVCHRMWHQSDCRMPPGPLEPEGSVRDDILALGRSLPPDEDGRRSPPRRSELRASRAGVPYDSTDATRNARSETREVLP